MTDDGYIRVYGIDGLVESFDGGGRLEEEGRYKVPRRIQNACHADYCDNFWNPHEEERNQICHNCGRVK